MEDKDVITPQKAFQIPILKVLIDLGGEAPLRAVYAHLKQELNLLPGDLGTRETGQIVWKNNAAWARARLVKSGELDGSTPGMWRITEKGREKYQREGSSYKQSDYKPVQRRKTRMMRRNSLRMTTKHLVHPSEATQEFLQQWGVKEGLNLFQLGFEGVRNKYWEFYQKRMRLSDDKILRSVHKHEREIKAFLNGKLPGDTGYEQICQWIHFCYLLEMYWEGKELFKMLSEDEIPEGLYNWAKKLAEACGLRVRT